MSNITLINLYLVRHGQTAWALAGKHTGRTDVPLTDEGRRQAQELALLLRDIEFSAAFVSPLARARDTAKLAGIQNATTCDDLLELDYGRYEGKTTQEIRQSDPDWTVWTHPCPGGETLEHAAQRAQDLIVRASEYTGNIAVIAHGHILRVLAATWLGLPASAGQLFMLDTATVSILSHEREARAIKLWNATSISH